MGDRLDKLESIKAYVQEYGCRNYLNRSTVVRDYFRGYIFKLLENICDEYEEVLGLTLPKIKLKKLNYFDYPDFKYVVFEYIDFFKYIDKLYAPEIISEKLKMSKQVYSYLIYELFELLECPDSFMTIYLKGEPERLFVTPYKQELRKSLLKLYDLDSSKALIRLKFSNPDIKLYLSKTPFYKCYTQDYPNNVLSYLRKRGLIITQYELDSYIRRKIVLDCKDSDYHSVFFTQIDKHLSRVIGNIEQIKYRDFKTDYLITELLLYLYEHRDKINLFYLGVNEMSFIVDKSEELGYYETMKNIVLTSLEKVGLSDMLFSIDYTTDIRKGIFLE